VRRHRVTTITSIAYRIGSRRRLIGAWRARVSDGKRAVRREKGCRHSSFALPDSTGCRNTARRAIAYPIIATSHLLWRLLGTGQEAVIATAGRAVGNRLSTMRVVSVAAVGVDVIGLAYELYGTGPPARQERDVGKVQTAATGLNFAKVVGRFSWWRGCRRSEPSRNDDRFTSSRSGGEDPMRRVLFAQLAIIALCLWSLTELALNFPYPSPLIRPFLPPTLRWPTHQIEGWVNSQDFPSSFLSYFARDPDRSVPTGQNLVSPADGTIGNILHRNGMSYLVIRMSFWDVHVIRAPAAGAVTGLDEEGVRVEREGDDEAEAADIYERGKDAPVQKIISLKTGYGDLKVRMITSYWASRLKVWIRSGENIKKGERIGRILLGSTTVLEMPGNVDFAVRPGQHVKAGETIVYSGE
jgi:phosphatidylserine decarboxylase